MGTWLTFAGAALIVAILNICSAKVQKISMHFSTGVCWGYCTSALICGALLALINEYDFVLMLALMTASSLIGAILLILKPNLLLTAINFGGCYIFIRGISLIFGGYPSEIEIFSKMQTGEPLLIRWLFWVYLCVFSILFASTFVIFKSKENEYCRVENDENEF